MLDYVYAIVDHSFCSFLCKLCINKRVCPGCLNFDIRIYRFRSVFISVNDLYKGISRDRSNGAKLTRLRSRSSNDSFYISGLLTCHNVGSYVVSGSVSLCADEFGIWVGLCNFQCRITELISVTDYYIIACTCIISISSRNISNFQVLCVSQLVSVFLTGFLCSFVCSLIPALVICCSGK